MVEGVYMYILALGENFLYFQNGLEFPYETLTISITFLRKFFSLVVLKYEAIAHGHIAISQYHSQFTDQVLHGKNRSLSFFQLPNMVKNYKLLWGYPMTNEVDR